MALLQKPPGVACAGFVRRLLACLVIFPLLATLANAEAISYNSWQWHGFTRTSPAPSSSASLVSQLSSVLLSSSPSSNVVSESAVVASLGDSTPSVSSSLSGFVYYDANSDGIRESTDWAIRDAIVSLMSASSNTVVLATTDENGEYSFKSLSPDDYTITLLTPSSAPGASKLVGILSDQNGTPVFSGVGVAASDTSVADIQLKDGYSGTTYDFPQLTYPTDLISKRMLLSGSSGVSHTPDAPPPPIPPVPEPSTLALLVVAGLCVTGCARRRRD
jgi:hypothetical protein